MLILQFDILVLRDQVAVKIRDGKVAMLTPIKEYTYEYYPVLNGRRFGVNLNSKEEFDILLEEYESANSKGEKALVEFSNKWLQFNLYRTLTFDLE